jgi:hypothetical protein
MIALPRSVSVSYEVGQRIVRSNHWEAAHERTVLTFVSKGASLQMHEARQGPTHPWGRSASDRGSACSRDVSAPRHDRAAGAVANVRPCQRSERVRMGARGSRRMGTLLRASSRDRHQPAAAGRCGPRRPRPRTRRGRRARDRSLAVDDREPPVSDPCAFRMGANPFTVDRLRVPRPRVRSTSATSRRAPRRGSFPEGHSAQALGPLSSSAWATQLKRLRPPRALMLREAELPLPDANPLRDASGNRDRPP